MVFDGAFFKRESLNIPRNTVIRCKRNVVDLLLVVDAPLAFLALEFDRSAVLCGVVSNCCVGADECCPEIRFCWSACSVRGVWIPLSPADAASPLSSDGFPDSV